MRVVRACEQKASFDPGLIEANTFGRDGISRLISKLRRLVSKPRHLVPKPRRLVSQPRRLVSRPRASHPLLDLQDGKSNESVDAEYDRRKWSGVLDPLARGWRVVVLFP